MTLVKLHYSEALIRRSVGRFWWRVIGWRFVGAFVLLLGSVAFLLASGDRSWLVGLMGAVVVLAITFAAALYLIHSRASLRRLRRMRRPEAELELGEERFRISSDAGTSELVWSAVTEVWSFPDVLLLFLSRAQFITLPVADLDAEAQESIVQKAKAHGAKVS